MSYNLIQNKEVQHLEASCLQEILSKYNDMYKYCVYIGGRLVYVVVKETQPTNWEHGWAE